MICGIKVYTRLSDHETILEVWGGSTKHPDCVFYFSDFQIPECWRGEDCIGQTSPIFLYQWMIECASKMMWWWNTKEITDFANSFYEVMLR